MSAKCQKRTLADHDVRFSSRAGGDTAMASDSMPHLATGHGRQKRSCPQHPVCPTLPYAVLRSAQMLADSGRILT